LGAKTQGHLYKKGTDIAGRCTVVELEIGKRGLSDSLLDNKITTIFILIFILSVVIICPVIVIPMKEFSYIKERKMRGGGGRNNGKEVEC
jgi:hypothetical protein